MHIYGGGVAGSFLSVGGSCSLGAASRGQPTNTTYKKELLSWIDRWIDRWRDGWIDRYGWIYRLGLRSHFFRCVALALEEATRGQPTNTTNKKEIVSWMDRWIDRWIDGWIDRYGWIYRLGRRSHFFRCVALALEAATRGQPTDSTGQSWLDG